MHFLENTILIMSAVHKINTLSDSNSIHTGISQRGGDQSIIFFSREQYTSLSNL